MEELRGRNAILTGASRGLGVYIARALAAEGVNLALAARTLAPVEELARELSASGVRAVAIRTDVAVAADRTALLQRAAAELGGIDILVNNAALETNLAFADFSLSAIDEMLNVDLVAPVLLTRELLPQLLERKTGHIVNIASLAGKSATPFNVPYSTAKGGLILFTHSLRAELRGTGVSTSVVVPGFVSETGMFAAKTQEHGLTAPAIVGTSTPEKVARAVVRVIKSDVLETIVAPGPMRLSQAFNQVFPEAFAWFVTRIGAMEPFKKMASMKSSTP
ncbi:MAG TPA: SDR family NAD(P)-dependent oxidoreductase [Polyangiales bacterium]|nr:SDR family NAD(P)-dependent oxidoreductase [Polyangiales bacterium]